MSENKQLVQNKAIKGMQNIKKVINGIKSIFRCKQKKKELAFKINDFIYSHGTKKL